MTTPRRALSDDDRTILLCWLDLLVCAAGSYLYLAHIGAVGEIGGWIVMLTGAIAIPALFLVCVDLPDRIGSGIKWLRGDRPGT